MIAVRIACPAPLEAPDTRLIITISCQSGRSPPLSNSFNFASWRPSGTRTKGMTPLPLVDRNPY